MHILISCSFMKPIDGQRRCHGFTMACKKALCVELYVCMGFAKQEKPRCCFRLCKDLSLNVATIYSDCLALVGMDFIEHIV